MKRLAGIFSKLYTIGFLLFWFGFLSVAAFLCIRDENYNTLLFTLPFWIAGIFIVKRRLLRNHTGKKDERQFPIGIIISILLVLITLVAGILFLIQGVMKSDMKLLFAGGFFAPAGLAGLRACLQGYGDEL